MGNIFFPNKKDLQKDNFKIPDTKNGTKQLTNVHISKESPDETDLGLKRIKEMVQEVEQSNLTAKGNRKRPAQLIDYESNDIPKLRRASGSSSAPETPPVFADDWMSGNEIENFLENLSSSSSGGSPGEVNEAGLVHYVFYGEQKEISNLTKAEVMELFKSEESSPIWSLVDNESKLQRLQILMSLVKKYRLTKEADDLKNGQGNNLAFVAFLNSNFKAFLYLTFKCCLEIPIYINVQETTQNIQRPFLLYMFTKNSPSMLLKVLKYIPKMYDQQRLNTHLLAIDFDLQANLITNLLQRYDNKQDDGLKILECLEFIFKSIPDIYTTRIIISTYSLDISILTYIIILRENGLIILEKIRPFLKIPTEEKQTYENIINCFYTNQPDVAFKFNALLS